MLVGKTTLLQKVMGLDAKAFDVVLFINFMKNPYINGRPARLVVENQNVPLRGTYEGNVRCIFILSNTESCSPKPNLREHALSVLRPKKTGVRVDLFASPENAQEEI